MEEYKAEEGRRGRVQGLQLEIRRSGDEHWTLDALLRSHFKTEGLNPPAAGKKTTNSSKVMTPSWEGLGMIDLCKSVSAYTSSSNSGKIG